MSVWADFESRTTNRERERERERERARVIAKNGSWLCDQ